MGICDLFDTLNHPDKNIRAVIVSSEKNFCLFVSKT